MIRINRAHDGKVIEVKQALSQFNSIDDLLHAMSLATAIPSDGIICMIADGSQLNNDLLVTLSQGEADETTEFFVFNREFLYADVDLLTQELTIEPALASPPSSIELVQPPTPRSLEAIVSWSHSISEHIHSHASTSQHHHSALSTIQRSTAVALLNLLSHSHNVKNGGVSDKIDSNRQLERMRGLLAGYQRDLELLGLVRVSSALLPPSSGNSSKRTLGDFVSRAKMSAVADACNRVYEALQSQLDELASNSSQLEADTRDLKLEVEGTSIAPSTESLEEALQAETRADELTTFLVETCSPDANGWPVADKLDEATITGIQQAVEELYLLDEVARESLRRLTADKNDMTARCLSLLGDISSLQSDYADLSAGLAAFNTEVNSGRVDGFRHLTRLNNMLWAYGATVIEVVRRREFTKLFLAKSQALAELMAKASSRERKRRDKYRTGVAGQLPWEIKGMDEAPPSLEISTSRASGTTPELDRKDLRDLLQLIQSVEETLAKADAISGDSTGEPLARVNKDLQELILRLDNMEEEFAVLVEKQLLGDDDGWEGGSEEGNGSDSSNGEVLRKSSRRRVLNGNGSDDRQILAATRKENERLQQENKELNQQAEEREQSDHHRHQVELTTTRLEASAMRAENRRLKEEFEAVQRKHHAAVSELEIARSDVQLERERRLNMQEELSLLRTEAQAARKEEEQARREISEEAERLVEAELHLQDLQKELEEARAARLDASNRVESLLSEGSNVERELSAAQEQIEDLLQQLEQGRQDLREVRNSLAEAEATKERVVRHHRAEADGDRAILEETLREHRDELTVARAELEKVRDSTKAEVEAAQTLRGQLRGADEAHEELVKNMEAAKDASVEAELALRHAERESEQLNELARPMLLSVLGLQGHVRALPMLSSSRSASASTPGPIEDNKQIGTGSEIEEETQAELSRQDALQTFTAAGTEADASMTLAALRAVRTQDLCQEVSKKLDALVTLVRKWQKTYKRYTADSNGKLAAAIGNRIAFRNFQVGDLALFLPSRNNTLEPKPWAAFNISCPHFFLNAPAKSVLAEQLRSKEWIVARIVRVIERVTDTNEQGGNPFQLIDRTRFCLLDVDGWNPSAPTAVPSRPTMTSTKPGNKGTEEDSRKSTDGAVQTSSAVLEVSSGAQKHEEAPTIGAVSTTLSAADPLSEVPVSVIDDCIAQINPPTVPETALEARRPSSAGVLTTQTGFSPKPASTAPAAPASAFSPSERSALGSSPSALTRAIRAASSRSPSTSRVRDFVSMAPASSTADPGDQSLVAHHKRQTNLSASQEAVSKFHISVDSSTSASTAPAFGLRGRRRGLRGGAKGGGGGFTSAATSPGTTTSAHRIIESTLEAAGNPFSQSPGGLFAASLPRLSPVGRGERETLMDAAAVRTADSTATETGPSPKGISTAAALPASLQQSPSTTSLSARRPTSLHCGAGSPTAVSSAVPLNAEASLTVARGETSGSFTEASLGGGGSRGVLKRPALATSSLAHGTAGFMARSPPAAAAAASASSKSPSFLLGAFGRKGGSVSFRGPVSTLLGTSAGRSGEGAVLSSSSSSPSPLLSSSTATKRVAGFDEGEREGNFSASDLLRRLSDGKTGGSANGQQ